MFATSTAVLRRMMRCGWAETTATDALASSSAGFPAWTCSSQGFIPWAACPAATEPLLTFQLLHFNEGKSVEGRFRSCRLFFHWLSHGLQKEEVGVGMLPVAAQILCFFWHCLAVLSGLGSGALMELAHVKKTGWAFSSGRWRWMMSGVGIHFTLGVENNVILRGTMSNFTCRTVLAPVFPWASIHTVTKRKQARP